MGIFFGNLFWGILIILLGISVLLRGFNINLPIMKVFFAIIIIMFGVRLLIGGGKPRIHHSGNRIGKSNIGLYSSDDQEYTMVFASGDIDLSNLQAGAKDMEVTVVFGSARVILPSDLRFNIQTTAVLGGIVLPKTGHFGFSDNNTTLNPESATLPIRIEATSVFGRLEFITKERSTESPMPVPDMEPLNPEEGF
jgi:predicted membrane protein